MKQVAGSHYCPIPPFMQKSHELRFILIEISLLYPYHWPEQLLMRSLALSLQVFQLHSPNIHKATIGCSSSQFIGWLRMGFIMVPVECVIQSGVKILVRITILSGSSFSEHLCNVYFTPRHFRCSVQVSNGIKPLLSLLNKLPQNIFISPIYSSRSVFVVSIAPRFAFSAAPLWLAWRLRLRWACHLLRIPFSRVLQRRTDLWDVISCVGRWLVNFIHE